MSKYVLNGMLTTKQTETIFLKARDVTENFPVTYEYLVGYERLAVLPVLREPIQSTMHAILQQKVAPGTRCILKGCDGTLDRTGKCSKLCSQSGVNIIQDIMDCRACDTMSFPCPGCHSMIFHGQLKMYLN